VEIFKDLSLLEKWEPEEYKHNQENGGFPSPFCTPRGSLGSQEPKESRPVIVTTIFIIYLALKVPHTLPHGWFLFSLFIPHLIVCAEVLLTGEWGPTTCNLEEISGVLSAYLLLHGRMLGL
jgi:hypothetical protein